MKLRRLPATVRFPYGYVIRVVLVTDGEMLEAMDEDKRDKDELSDGLWDVGERVIRVRRSLPLKRKWYVLSHEMDHAHTDWQHWLLDTGKAAA